MVFLFWISKKFQNSDFLWKISGVFRIKPRFFCRNRVILQVRYTIRLRLCFYSKSRKSFRIWILLEKVLDFFKNANLQKKLLSASRNVLMLRSSQNIRDLDFLEGKMFFGKKACFFRKIAYFGNFFIECISYCNIAQEFSKLSKPVFYLGKKTVCSKKILASFQKQ